MANLMSAGVFRGPQPRQPLVVNCTTCGHDWAPLFTPAPLDMVAKALRKAKCPNCGKHPHTMGFKPQPTKPGDVDGWLHNGDTGVSSLTLWQAIRQEDPRPRMGIPVPGGLTLGGHPGDPQDFGRCHRLLMVVEENALRVRGLRRVATHYPRWVPFVAEWGELTALYLEELSTGSCPQLYARMHQLSGGRKDGDPVDMNDQAAVEKSIERMLLSAGIAAAMEPKP